jgi:hypothetical protein
VEPLLYTGLDFVTVPCDDVGDALTSPVRRYPAARDAINITHVVTVRNRRGPERSRLVGYVERLGVASINSPMRMLARANASPTASVIASL